MESRKGILLCGQKMNDKPGSWKKLARVKGLKGKEKKRKVRYAET
jgi:hypothetical protein